MAAHDGRVGVVDEDVGAAVEGALEVVLDGDADGRSHDDLADVASDVAPGDGRVQAVAVGRDDAANEPAADAAERSRDAHVELALGHGCAIVQVCLRHVRGADPPGSPYTRWHAEHAGRRACPRRRPARHRAPGLPAGAAARRVRVRARPARSPLPARPPIRIYFEHYFRAQRSRPATSTVLSIEGGPGFSTTADRAARLQLWRPVSARRDLLLVDLRGTGRSGALNCPAFRRHILPYIPRAGRCAAQLGPSRDDYDTSQSVQDLAPVLNAIGAGKIDLYGDSYGSYAAQAFAIRYPHRLRSLVARRHLPAARLRPGPRRHRREHAELACRWRAPAGRAARAGGRPLALVEKLLRRVRAHPITGVAPDADGTRIHVSADPDTLAQLLQSGFYYQGVWRDVFAATRSAFAGDNAPLLRLVAETVTTDGPNGDAREFTESLYLSVICHDYPELWPAGTPVAAAGGVRPRGPGRVPAGGRSRRSPRRSGPASTTRARWPACGGRRRRSPIRRCRRRRPTRTCPR